MTDIVTSLLQHPLTKGVNLDDPKTTSLRLDIIRSKPFLMKWVYLHLHHEQFEPNAEDWIIESFGPLSGANGALPWIIFNRDRKIFTNKYPKLKILNIKPIMPISYLLSGGISMRSF